jgi:hypothetical protein
VRLFHWLVVVLVMATYVTLKLNWIDWHVRIGEALPALVIARLLWGCLGSETARFRGFAASPMATLRHLRHLFRREPDVQVGYTRPAAGGRAAARITAGRDTERALRQQRYRRRRTAERIGGDRDSHESGPISSTVHGSLPTFAESVVTPRRPLPRFGSIFLQRCACFRPFEAHRARRRVLFRTLLGCTDRDAQHAYGGRSNRTRYLSAQQRIYIEGAVSDSIVSPQPLRRN